MTRRTAPTITESNTAAIQQLQKRQELIEEASAEVERQAANPHYSAYGESLQQMSSDLRDAASTVQEEAAIRRRLDDALKRSTTNPPESAQEVQGALGDLAALRKTQPKLYKKGAIVADPCVRCIQLALHKQRRHADSKRLASINKRLGTKVNFAALAGFEGGQQTKGYVPRAGKSGVTVATGVDIGQMSENQVRGLGLSNDLTNRLLPYANKQRSAAEAALKKKPLNISQEEADALDEVVQERHLQATRDEWNRRRPEGGTAFEDLSSAQQTVLLSRTYHQGVGMPDIRTSRAFYNDAQHGRWEEVESDLRSYPAAHDVGWYQTRVNGEADLLRRERESSGNDRDR